MRLPEEMLEMLEIFQKRFEDLKYTGQTFFQKNLPYVEFSLRILCKYLLQSLEKK